MVCNIQYGVQYLGILYGVQSRYIYCMVCNIQVYCTVKVNLQKEMKVYASTFLSYCYITFSHSYISAESMNEYYDDLEDEPQEEQLSSESNAHLCDKYNIIIDR